MSGENISPPQPAMRRRDQVFDLPADMQRRAAPMLGHQHGIQKRAVMVIVGRNDGKIPDQAGALRHVLQSRNRRVKLQHPALVATAPQEG